MSKQTSENTVNQVKVIMDEYKSWRKEFNAKWDALREKQREEAKAYKEQFDKWQSELDKKIAERDAALAKAPKVEKSTKAEGKKPAKKAAAMKPAKKTKNEKVEADAVAEA